MEEKLKAAEGEVAALKLSGKKLNPVILERDSLRTQLAEANAKLWVAKDSQLRTYDGLAEKAARVDEVEEKLEVARAALGRINEYLEDIDKMINKNAPWIAHRIWESAQKLVRETLSKIGARRSE